MTINQARQEIVQMRTERKKMESEAVSCTDQINALLSSVREIRDGVAGATKNSNIGAFHCNHAAESVISKCDKAIRELNALNASGCYNGSTSSGTGPVNGFYTPGGGKSQMIEVNSGLFFKANAFRSRSNALRQEKASLSGTYQEMMADNNAGDLNLSAERFNSMCGKLDRIADMLESYASLLLWAQGKYLDEQRKAIRRAAGIPT